MTTEENQPASTGFESMNHTFARIEEIGARFGLAVTLIGFTLYVSGALAPFLSIEALVENWGSRAQDFARNTGLPTGWGWAGMLGYSDMLALAGLILLSSVVIGAYLGLLVVFLRQRSRAYILLVLLQLGVFALAAAGLGGGH